MTCLELVLDSACLGHSLALRATELAQVGLGLRVGSLHGGGLFRLLVALEPGAEQLNLPLDLVGGRLDGHTTAVETLRKQSSSTLHPGETSAELWGPCQQRI